MGVGSLPGTSLVLQPRMARLRPSLTEKCYPSLSSQPVTVLSGRVTELLGASACSSVNCTDSYHHAASQGYGRKWMRL